MKLFRFVILPFLLGLITMTGSAQMVIAAATNMASGGTPDVIIQAPSRLTNNSAFDFSVINLVINLTGSSQDVNGKWVVKSLSIDGGGNKRINGPLTITNTLHFVNGLIVPNAKVLYVGDFASITGDSDASFVNGPFSVQQVGRLKFPIGATGLGYAPAFIENNPGTQEITMEAVATGAGLTPDVSSAELIEIDNTRYWILTAADIAAINSAVTLNTLGVSVSNALSPVVVEADMVNGTGFSLGSSASGSDAVTSRSVVSKSILAVGGSAEIELRVHDMITPFTKDGANDHLHIESIEKFDLRKVTLLDRWGGLVKEWNDFTNYDDPLSPNTDGYDFAGLSPGQYICVVEYGFSGGETRKKSQMVTVLKAK